MDKEQLETLPVCEVKETIWFREYYLNGKLIEKHSLIRIFTDWMRGNLTRVIWEVKIKVSSYLLRGCADPCPYCNKLIERNSFKKAFPEAK